MVASKHLPMSGRDKAGSLQDLCSDFGSVRPNMSYNLMDTLTDCVDQQFTCVFGQGVKN